MVPTEWKERAGQILDALGIHLVGPRAAEKHDEWKSGLGAELLKAHEEGVRSRPAAAASGEE